MAIKGHFNANSDLHYLIDLIDNLKIKYKDNQEDKDKEIKANINIKEKKENSAESTTKYNNDKNIKFQNSGEEKTIKNNNYINNLNDKNKKSKIIEEDIKILRIKNMPKISKFLEEFINQNNLKLKRSNSMINLRPHSQTIASATTCDESFEDTNLNINHIININKKESINKNERNFIIDEINKDVDNDNNYKKQKFMKTIERSKTISLLREMTPIYKEVNENNKNLIYKMPEKILRFILVDLMLKKIIFEDFMIENSSIVYHFCKQCFSFVNKEVFFRKIIHCYKFYRNKNISFKYLKNLIEFINILVIEMFEYYQKINFNDVHINLVKKFYIELINDIISDLKEEENDKIIRSGKKKDTYFYFFGSSDFFENNNNNNNNFNDVLNRKNLIKMNLNNEDIKSFNLKEKIPKEKKENKPKKQMKLKNDIIIKEDKNYLNNYNINRLCGKILIKENNKDEKEETTIEIGKNQNQQKLYQMLRNLRKSHLINLKEPIKEVILEDDREYKSEEEEEDDKTKKSNKSDNKKKSYENEEDKEEIINNIYNSTFSSQKIISIKEEILKEIQYIFLLIDIKKGEEASFYDIRDAKDNLPFYGLIKNLSKEKNKKYAQSNGKKLANSTTHFKLGSLSFNSQINNRDYLKKGYFCITDWKTEEIGEKLTQVTISLLNKIYPKEIYQGVFLKKEKEITSPNVINCINNFNKLTSFIIEDIISYDFPKERAKIYDKWVQVADYCKTNKNYNDCIAIYSALNNYIISGLKLTQKEIKSKTKYTFEKISNFCSCETNYKKIRDDMNLCESNGQIFIPYLGMFLRDINFYEESSKYINEYGCINIEKIEKINNIMEKYFKYKIQKSNKIYNIKELNFFEKLEKISIEKLEEIAAKIEPIFKFNVRQIKRITNIDKKYFAKKNEKLRGRGTITSNSKNTFGFFI